MYLHRNPRNSVPREINHSREVVLDASVGARWYNAQRAGCTEEGPLERSSGQKPRIQIMFLTRSDEQYTSLKSAIIHHFVIQVLFSFVLVTHKYFISIYIIYLFCFRKLHVWFYRLKPCSCAQFAPGCNFAPPYVAFICQ